MKNTDYRYNLIREPHTPSMQQALGAESPTSINSIFVPDLIITKQF